MYKEKMDGVGLKDKIMSWLNGEQNTFFEMQTIGCKEYSVHTY